MQVTQTATVTQASSCGDMANPYITAEGKVFSLDCDTGYTISNLIDTTVQSTFLACLNHCAATSSCTQFEYSPENQACYAVGKNGWGVVFNNYLIMSGDLVSS